MKDISELLDEVVDEKSFLVFASALIADRKRQEGKNSEESGFSGDWANNTITDFLEGAVSWAEDTDFGVSKDPDLEVNKWKTFAVFLYCGKIYE